MVQVRIDADEVYPVYEETRGMAGVLIEVEDETLARWRRVAAEYATVQAEMHTLAEQAYANLRTDRR